jgi:hypothetical protein
MDDALAFKNAVALQFVRASLGLLAPSVRAASLELSDNVATLHFALAERTPAVLEDISDIQSEFDVLAPRRLEIRVMLHEAAAAGPLPQLPGIWTYRAKP